MYIYILFYTHTYIYIYCTYIYIYICLFIFLLNPHKLEASPCSICHPGPGLVPVSCAMDGSWGATGVRAMDGLLIMRDLLQKRFACLNIEIIIEIYWGHYWGVSSPPAKWGFLDFIRVTSSASSSFLPPSVRPDQRKCQMPERMPG